MEHASGRLLAALQSSGGAARGSRRGRRARLPADGARFRGAAGAHQHGALFISVELPLRHAQQRALAAAPGGRGFPTASGRSWSASRRSLSTASGWPGESAADVVAAAMSRCQGVQTE